MNINRNKNSFLEAIWEVNKSFMEDYNKLREIVEDIPASAFDVGVIKELYNSFFSCWKDHIEDEIKYGSEDIWDKVREVINKCEEDDWVNIKMVDLLTIVDNYETDDAVKIIKSIGEKDVIQSDKSVCRGTKDDGLGNYEDLKKHNLNVNVNGTDVVLPIVKHQSKIELDDDPDWKISEEEKQDILEKSFKWFTGRKNKRETCFG